jgi:6-phosphofructo-2-kinase
MSNHSEKTIFALVGLPARGKSFLSAKIVTFFNWSGIPAKIFNVGSRRRVEEGAAVSGRSSFFDSQNTSAVSKRDAIALSTLGEAVEYLCTPGEEGGGVIAIFDATNTTIARRALLQDYVGRTQGGVKINLVFIESICNDEEILSENFRQKVRHSPDFAGMDEVAALLDLKLRVEAYENIYETINDDENIPYIKIIDLASKVICYQLWGTLSMRCVQLLMCCHAGSRPIYLARAGHCEGVDDLSHGLWFTGGSLIGGGGGGGGEAGTSTPGTGSAGIAGSAGPYAQTRSSRATSREECKLDPSAKMPSALTCNAHLSAAGKTFSRRFAKYIQLQGHGEAIVPFCSTMPRALETISYLGCAEDSLHLWSSLGILDTGILHGLSVEYIQTHMPEDYSEWERDPLHYRFPGGESILDMNKRLAEVVLELEHLHKPVAVVSHLSTIQTLVAYFTGKDPNSIPHIVVPRHSVLVLQPSIYGWALQVVSEDELPEVLPEAPE